MRPFGNKYTIDQVSKDKDGDFEPYLAVYDNLNLKAAHRKGTMNIKHGIMMPGFSENVRPFIKELSEENNYLRFVFPPDLPHFSMFNLLTHARQVRACIHTFILNFSEEIKTKNGKHRFCLPEDYQKNTYYLFNVD